MKEKSFDIRLVGWIGSYILLLQSALMFVSFLVCIGYGESDWKAFAIGVGITAVCGSLSFLGLRKTDSRLLHRREGFLVTALGWVIFSLFGMIPFLLSSHPLGVADAFFETMSGVTTTGASVIPDVEIQSHGILLWRAMIQWAGGLGIILLMLAVIPVLNSGGSLTLFNAELTGITHDKIHPRISSTARSLWQVYVILTLAMIILLWIGPMDLFDSVCHSFSTLSTGGFSTRNAGLSSWHSDYVGWVVTIFMFLGGINFILLYYCAVGKWKSLFQNDVARFYIILVILFAVGTGLCQYFYANERNFGDIILQSFFTVCSAFTSTGYSYGNYELWGPFVLFLLLIMMIFGACAGSTSGGMKADRILALFKNAGTQTSRTLYPNHLMPIRVNGSLVSEERLGRVAAFAFLYLSIIGVGALLLSAFGIGSSDSFFAATSCVGNSGLGYGLTGSEGGFRLLPDASKWVMSLMMLIGRLELFTVLVLFLPFFWRK